MAHDRDALLRDHGPRIWGLCRRLDPDPEDAYQAIWEQVFRKLDRFDPQGAASLGTWIHTLAHRQLIDRHRRRQVRRVEPEQETPCEAPSPPERLIERRRHRALERALAQLPEAQRRVIVLHHLHGVPLPTLADEEGVALGTLKSRLHRGRAALARLLEA